MRSALNSSVVWELTTEGERPFHCGIVRGKWVLQCITVCLVSTILGTVWCRGRFQLVSRGQVHELVFFYRHSTECNAFYEREAGRTDPFRPQETATQARQAYRWHYLYFAISCRTSGLLSSELSLSEVSSMGSKWVLHTLVWDEPKFCMQLPLYS